MSKKLAPQSAPPYRAGGRDCKRRYRPATTTAGAHRNSANKTRLQHSDICIEDLEQQAMDNDSDNLRHTGTLSSKSHPGHRDRHHGDHVDLGDQSETEPVGPLLSHTGTIILQSRTHSQPSSHIGALHKTINRSQRKLRPQTTPGGLQHHDESSHGTDSVASTASTDADGRTLTRTTTSDMLDFGGTDIYMDKGWDTDLEEDEVESVDRSGRAIYVESCKGAGVIPASYFLRHMNDSSLHMKHHGLGPNGIKPISVALLGNTDVLTLNLTDNWLGFLGGHHVVEMLKENCYITHIDLSDNRLDHRFAEEFIAVMEHNATLTHVTLSGNDFDDQAAVYLAEGIMTTSKLQFLDLSHNQLGEGAGKILGPAIAENTSLKELDLSWNSIRRKGAVAIGQGIKNNILLQKINLSWNGFGNDGAKALGDALKVNSTLEHLDVSNNRITTEGAVLLAKGISVSETLKVLKIGKNPMQSSGCYGICAAILKNLNCVMEQLDFSDVMVNNDFHDVFNKVRENLPDIKMRHGGDAAPKRAKARVHPMVKLQNYISKHNLKLLDFFNKFDADGSMSVSREEFTEGIQQTGIKLTTEEVAFLLDELDADGDGEINYSELVMGHQDFTEKERKMATTIMQYKK